MNANILSSIKKVFVNAAGTTIPSNYLFSEGDTVISKYFGIGVVVGTRSVEGGDFIVVKFHDYRTEQIFSGTGMFASYSSDFDIVFYPDNKITFCGIDVVSAGWGVALSYPIWNVITQLFEMVNYWTYGLKGVI